MAIQTSHMTPAARAKSSNTWAFRNALTDMSIAVLPALALGDQDKVMAIATARLADIRERFGDDMVFRLPASGDAA